ncbi:Aste57867_13047 [Aphanomyces stellatus]|uniref:Aste57867_13047 protein n=1 Tax=Aphanomyces stellatus TaxID=120398 RepID=A0A485KXG6_9STRA|nr:hypothetical protein As57867_012999 [Aphanomyces stellatus]VFT89892.1 Aste57867_13047 [Aphanomyces stellatus]
METLASFQRLYGIYISFCNMIEWSPDANSTVGLPASLTALRLRYTNLTAVPTVLAVVPPNLVYLRLESMPISTIPNIYFKAWANISSISLNDINLTQIPDALANSSTLEWLERKGNSITSVPLDWQPRLDLLQTVDLSGNALEEGPWHLAKTGLVLDLSSNPIATVPSVVDIDLLKKRYVILDDSPYCSASPPVIQEACKPKCAHLCETARIGDANCDWPCYVEACQFDGGDCDSYGLS